jgi:alkylation response protein AidB-like acyl-CoA dehydrogenase
MNFDLSEEQKLLQKTTKEFVRHEIDPIAGEIDHQNRIPDSLIRKMADLRLLGMTLPEEFGGAGMGCLDAVLAIEQLSYSGTGVWWLAAFNNSIPNSILAFGTEEQKRRYLPPVCRGEVYASIQFTEPETGSDPKALATTAIREEDGYRINGTKRFSTFGAREGFAVLYAKDEDGRCSAFVVNKNSDGYSTGSAYALMGSGGIEAVDVRYENFRAPRDSVLGKPGKGMEVLLHWIAEEKIQQCGACLGIANAALDEARAYATTRKTRTGLLSDMQGIQWMIAEMQAKRTAIRWVAYRAAALKDNGASDWKTEAAAAKTFIVPAAMEIVELSRRIHGAYGYTKEFKIERLYRAIAGASAIAVSLEINKSIAAAPLL